jgi:hypothetical protein
MRRGEEGGTVYHCMDEGGRKLEVSLNDGGALMAGYVLLNAVSILRSMQWI